MAGRKEIRNKFASLISANLVDVGSRVYTTRATPLIHANLPCVVVYVDSDTIDASSYNTAPRYYAHTANVVVEIFVTERASGSIEDQLDDLASAAAHYIELSDAGAVVWQDCNLRDIEFAVEPDGKKLIGMARLTYLVTYESDTTGELPPLMNAATFDTASVTHQPNAAADVAEDLLTDINQED